MCIREGMKDLLEQQENVWNQSYDRGGNICFYPNEEVIRFLNRYIRKRKDVSSFSDILPLISQNNGEIAGLDLGCGIGRHVRLMDDFGIDAYGIDLSDTAIMIGQNWMRQTGKERLADRLIIGSVTELPFEDNYFGVCISAGVLDSMPRDVAQKGMREVSRVLKSGGYMYLDLIMGSNSPIREGDETVDFGYEKGTVQSYFTISSIEGFLSNFKIIDFNIITYTDPNGIERNKRAHLVIQN